jgi:hypothetical protein
VRHAAGVSLHLPRLGLERRDPRPHQNRQFRGYCHLHIIYDDGHAPRHQELRGRVRRPPGREHRVCAQCLEYIREGARAPQRGFR